LPTWRRGAIVAEEETRLPEKSVDEVTEHAKGRERLLLLDYDGTLVPFASLPELAAPDAPLLALLSDLAARADTRVHIVSGRSRDSLDAWLGHLPLGLHAEHGYWTRPDPRAGWAPRFDDVGKGWMDRALALMTAATAAVPGALIERKTASLAWHYRNGDPALAAAAREALHAGLEPLCAAHGVGLLDGVFVLEIRERRAHKGLVVREIVADLQGDPLVVAIGDDVTDEDMFAALPEGGVAIAAGPGATSPVYRLDGPARVRSWLRRLCEPAAASR
jgi:trehalose 6-phosphate synthase/phosphatase